MLTSDPSIPITELLPINEADHVEDLQQLPQHENVQQVPDRLPVTTTRSGRQVFLPARYNAFVALDSTSCNMIEFDTLMYDPLSFASSTDSDVMHLGQALKQPDRENFIEAMQKEVRNRAAFTDPPETYGIACGLGHATETIYRHSRSI
jgi:alpha-N-acetylglucosamine transferase